MPDPTSIFSQSIFGDWLMREIEFVTETEGEDHDSALNLTLVAYKCWLMAPLMSMTAGAAAVELSIRKSQELAQVVAQKIQENKEQGTNDAQSSGGAA